MVLWWRMNKASWIGTRLYHLRVLLIGDEDLVKNGKMIPCKKCLTYFMGYAHFGDFSYVYDGWCPECVEEKRREREQKSN